MWDRKQPTIGRPLRRGALPAGVQPTCGCPSGRGPSRAPDDVELVPGPGTVCSGVHGLLTVVGVEVRETAEEGDLVGEAFGPRPRDSPWLAQDHHPVVHVP